MLEESRMEKKVNRSSQLQSKASSIDCKKSTDLTHKPWPRNNKKREGPGSTPKNEPYRKNVPATRGRSQVDRRPRARGSSSFLVGGTPSTGLEDDDEPEIGSVFVPGSKKQNLNHLLNFIYPTRGGGGSGPLDRRGPPRRYGPPRVSYRHEHDLYLRAYCQFVVKEDGDYTVNLVDPDVPVKWEQIEEIVVRSTGKSECPICLGAPVAGRVGRCGHVYCWGCVLHYAAAHERRPPPCPVCAAPLHVPDMKPTKMVQWDPPAERVTMRLVRRLRGSTSVEIAPPRGQLTQSTSNPILPLDKINDAPYCKLFIATKQQVQEILERERKEIEDQIFAEIDTSEITYLEQALEMLKLKEEKNEMKFEQPKEVEYEVENDVPIVYEKQETNANKLDWFDVNDEGAACIEIIQEQMEELSINIDSNLNPDAPVYVQSNDNQVEEFPLIDCSLEIDQVDDYATVTDIDKQNQAKYFYFYQADDGQQVFLNSLNVRILNASWGTLAAAPPLIRGRVLHRETLPLVEQTRKHMPYTSHLPLHCSFDIVELDLQPPFVTDGALKSFSEELERRARVRARQSREERRRERAYHRGLEGPPRPDLTSAELFPPAPCHSSPPLNTPPFNSPPLNSPPLTAFEPAQPPLNAITPSSGPQFAKVASTSGTWRVRKAAPPSPVPPPDEELSAPRALVLSDAIEAALNAAASPSNKKSKKSKQKVLFATGMQRAA